MGGLWGYNPSIEPQMTSYLRLFVTLFLKRYILLLLFLKQVPVTVGLSRLFYVQWARSQKWIPTIRRRG